MTRRNPGDGHDDADGWRDDSGRVDSPGFAGSWHRVRPSFDDPMSWSVQLGRVASIDVRIHTLFLLYAAFQLLSAAFPAADSSGTRLSLGNVTIMLIVLFAIVLLHEFGHAIACRRWGGVADEILMWPLGGLAFVSPPQDWRAHFWTALGGPLVNVAILCVTIPALGLATGRWWGVALPSPFTMSRFWTVSDSPWLITLYFANWLSLVLLLFNLLPLFPLDGGRLLQAGLWPRLGYAPAMRLAVRAGYVGAIGLGMYGLLAQQWLLVGIALFGGLTCRKTVQDLDYTEQSLGTDDAEGQMYAASLEASRRELEAERQAEEKRRAAEAARRQSDEARRASEEAEFDRILDKIRTSGLGSLTSAERKVLERETERRRRETGGADRD